MKPLIIAIISILSTNTYANMDFYMSGPIVDEFTQVTKSNDLCPNTTSKSEIENIINILIQDYFQPLLPALKSKRLKIREFENDEYFLKTFFKLGHILKEERTYYIDINKKLYQCAPSKLALRSILAHEIQHILDYKNSNSIELVKIGARMLRKKSRSYYERSTDYKIMEMGLSQGIKEYREWIYLRLSGKGLKTKQCFYYTPEEINRYNQGEDDFSDYYNKYCKKN